MYKILVDKMCLNDLNVKNKFTKAVTRLRYYLVADDAMLTLMTLLKHPDTIVNCQQVVAQVTSIFCPADVLEVTRSGRNCLHAT